MTKKTGKILLLGCVLTPFTCVLSSLLHVFRSARITGAQATCVSNVKSLAEASLQYADEFDQRLPAADRWMDRLSPFVPTDKVTAVFHCPELEMDQYGYAMNSKIAGKSLKKIQNQEDTYLIFETANLGRNVSGDSATILTTPRHLSATVSYVDGHARNFPH